MKKPVLVVMAAGIGSRYGGGIKQLASVGPSGEPVSYTHLDVYKRQVLDNSRAFAVEKFVEKPNLEKAQEYLESEQYLWNSGMFVWKVSTILSNFEQHMPDLYAGLKRIQSAVGTESQNSVLEKEFSLFASESIDYGIV